MDTSHLGPFLILMYLIQWRFPGLERNIWMKSPFHASLNSLKMTDHKRSLFSLLAGG